MKEKPLNLKKILSLSLGLVVLATVTIRGSTGTVGASPHINSVIASPATPSIPVNVVNSPLSVTGSVTANIGTPTVNINGTVPVSGTVAVSSLNNTSTTPLYVRDVDNGANNPFCDRNMLLAAKHSRGNAGLSGCDLYI